MLFVRSFRFEEAEEVVNELDKTDFLDLYGELHLTEYESSYFSVKAGERDKRHLRQVREILECFDIPEELLAKKNIALVCRAISKRHILDQLRTEMV